MSLEKFIQRLPLAALAAHGTQGKAQIDLDENGGATGWHAEAPKSQYVNSTYEEVPLDSARAQIYEPITFEQTYRNAPDSWNPDLAKKYDALVIKEALGTISGLETKELDAMQKFRRRTLSPASGEEILLRYKREKLDRELIKVLQRHVRLQPITKNHT
jgi:hypothetical protein